MNELMNNNNNQLIASNVNDSMSVDVARVTAEVQGSIIIAKKLPRCQFAAENRILQACQRLSLAESAIYSYPKGKTVVQGPSIRLAEMIAQNWGNLRVGVREIKRDMERGESEVECFAWDMETNLNWPKTFTVSHERKANGQVHRITDPRELYELIANFAARRLRSCIFAVVPGDIVEKAFQACKETLAKGSNAVPFKERISNMVKKFTEIGVSIEMLEHRLTHKVDLIDTQEFNELISIYNSMRDGVTKRTDWFEFDQPKNESKKVADDLTAKFKEAQPEKK